MQQNGANPKDLPAEASAPRQVTTSSTPAPGSGAKEENQPQMDADKRFVFRQ
jgi:hypothetical protein